MTRHEIVQSILGENCSGTHVFKQIAKVLVGELAELVMLKLFLDDSLGVFEEGFFSVNFRSETPGRNGVVYDRVRGIIGGEDVNDGFLMRAWLFVYWKNERISVNGGEFLELHYEWVEGNGTWIVRGWQSGELGEFDEFDTFDHTVRT